MDVVEGNNAIAASGSAGLTLSGTKWPLLPNQRMRVWNVGANFLQDTGVAALKAQKLSIFLQLLDGSKNIILDPSQNFAVAFQLAAVDFTDPAPMGADGFYLAKSGRPLIDLQSGFLIAGVTEPTPAFAQLVAKGDFVNTDAVNPQQIDGILTALLSWE